MKFAKKKTSVSSKSSGVEIPRIENLRGLDSMSSERDSHQLVSTKRKSTLQRKRSPVQEIKLVGTDYKRLTNTGEKSIKSGRDNFEEFNSDFDKNLDNVNTKELMNGENEASKMITFGTRLQADVVESRKTFSEFLKENQIKSQDLDLSYHREEFTEGYITFNNPPKKILTPQKMKFPRKKVEVLSSSSSRGNKISIANSQLTCATSTQFIDRRSTNFHEHNIENYNLTINRNNRNLMNLLKDEDRDNTLHTPIKKKKYFNNENQNLFDYNKSPVRVVTLMMSESKTAKFFKKSPLKHKQIPPNLLIDDSFD